MSRDGEPFVAIGPDEFRFDLPESVRRLLVSLAQGVSPKITSRDPVAWRLFPTAHPDDPERATAFDELIGRPLTESRLTALNLIGRTSTAERLTRGELESWMRGLGMIRLVLAEEPPQPGAARERRLVLSMLAELQHAAVEALDAEDGALDAEDGALNGENEEGDAEDGPA